jgi:hypothetical protein
MTMNADDDAFHVCVWLETEFDSVLFFLIFSFPRYAHPMGGGGAGLGRRFGAISGKTEPEGNAVASRQRGTRKVYNRVALDCKGPTLHVAVEDLARRFHGIM